MLLNPQESHILSLAPELIEAISDRLDLRSVKHLRLTCKSLAELLNHAVLRTVSIEITRNNFEQGLSKLETLSTSMHAACSGTRELNIGSLSPAYDPNFQGPAWRYIGGEWKSETPPEDPPEIAIAEQEMGFYLYNALASMKGVQSVDWMPLGKDSEQTHRSVMNALKTFPNLRRLRVNLYNCRIPLELDSLTGLQEISIEETSAMYQEVILESLAKLVAQSTDLTSINISSNWGYRRPTDGSQSLHKIFKYYPSGAPPLRLRHLGLKFCLLRLDGITMPHLKNLTSLDITSIEEPHAYMYRYSEDEAEQSAIFQQKKRHGSNLEDVWKMLRISGVHLEAAILDVVTHSFLDYMSSYTGLKKLHLTPGGFHDGASSDRMAELFFLESFDAHAQSLEDLQIPALYEGLWCFGSHNLGSISKCINLKAMRLGVISAHLGRQEDDQYCTSEPDVLKLLIDTAVITMPHIESIHVAGANREQLRWARCGNPAMSHFARVNERLERSVSEYRAPSSCSRLPPLKVNSSGRRLFVGSRTSSECNSTGTDVREGPLRYIDISPQSDSSARRSFSDDWM